MKIDHSAAVANREPADEPELFIQDCQCGLPICDRFIIALRRPVIKPLGNHPNELVSMVYVPIKHAQSLVDEIRRLAATKGFEVK